MPDETDQPDEEIGAESAEDEGSDEA
jgi:hypothetical protein